MNRFCWYFVLQTLLFRKVLTPTDFLFLPLQGSVPPVMAFHLGSLGFLTPFKFESYRTEVAKVLEGKAKLSVKLVSNLFNQDAQNLRSWVCCAVGSKGTRPSLCAAVWRWRWWRICFRGRGSSRRAESRRWSITASFLMDTPTARLGRSPCSCRWEVAVYILSLFSAMFLFYF